MPKPQRHNNFKLKKKKSAQRNQTEPKTGLSFREEGSYSPGWRWLKSLPNGEHLATFINAYSLPNTNSKHCKEKALVEKPGKAVISSLARATWEFMGEMECDYGLYLSQGKRITGRWSPPTLTNGIPDVTDYPPHLLFLCFTLHCHHTGARSTTYQLSGTI